VGRGEGGVGEGQGGAQDGERRSWPGSGGWEEEAPPAASLRAVRRHQPGRQGTTPFARLPVRSDLGTIFFSFIWNNNGIFSFQFRCHILRMYF